MSIVSHSVRTDDPHDLSLDDLGLNNVHNYPMATRSEILALSRNDRYIDVDTADEYIQEAFTAYVDSLGLLLGDKVMLPPRDVSHLVDAYFNVDRRLYIKGAVQGTSYMRVSILENSSSFNSMDEFYMESFDISLYNSSFRTGRSYQLEMAFFPDYSSTFPTAVAFVDVFDQFKVIDEGRIRDIIMDLGDNTPGF